MNSPGNCMSAGVRTDQAWNTVARDDPLLGLPQPEKQPLPADPFVDCSLSHSFTGPWRPIFIWAWPVDSRTLRPGSAAVAGVVISTTARPSDGKSSVLEAGLLPSCRESHRHLLLRRDVASALGNWPLSRMPGLTACDWPAVGTSVSNRARCARCCSFSISEVRSHSLVPALPPEHRKLSPRPPPSSSGDLRVCLPGLARGFWRRPSADPGAT